MAKKTTERAKIADFIAKKIKKEENNNKTTDIIISSMDKSFTVKMPKDSEILDYIEEIGGSQSPKKIMSETLKLVYNNCEDLQDTELHKALELKEPYDILLGDSVFDFKDKNEIMDQFNKFVGFKAETIDEEIKNS